jgi:predicted nucleic acid-binding protein
MRADLVVDASVLAKFFFHEPGSEEARAALTSGAVIAAPSLVLVELASIAVKKVRIRAATLERARSAMDAVGDVVDRFEPIEGLARRAFQIAADTGCSAHDATYLALADALDVPFLTVDDRFIGKVAGSGFAPLVRRLPS